MLEGGSVDRQTYFQVSAPSAVILAYGATDPAGGLVHTASIRGYSVITEILVSGGPVDIAVAPPGAATPYLHTIWAGVPSDVGPHKMSTVVNPEWEVHIRGPVTAYFHLSGIQIL